jgi:hypothetical protein
MSPIAPAMVRMPIARMKFTGRAFIHTILGMAIDRS